MMVVLHSSETLVFARAAWYNIPENYILHSYRRENLKSYIFEGKDNLEDQGSDKRFVLKLILKKLCRRCGCGMDFFFTS
jgi:hypothetical protein